MPNEIKDILTACQHNDRSAQEKLYRNYYGYAMSICLPYTKDKTEAEEVANDGFIKVFNHLSSYDSVQSFKGWLRRIMVNSAIDYYRRNKKHYNHDDIENAYDADSFDTSVIDQLSANEIMEQVQKLPPAYQLVFNLYAVEGYKHQEIAKQLNISEGTSKSNLYKAKAKLKEQLELAHIKPN